MMIQRRRAKDDIRAVIQTDGSHGKVLFMTAQVRRGINEFACVDYDPVTKSLSMSSHFDENRVDYNVMATA
jgi:hypothetical protein